MATKVTYLIVDDLDGSTDQVGTHRFAVDGITYEIDLSEPNAGRLRAALAPFITAGRRLPRTATAPVGKPATRTPRRRHRDTNPPPAAPGHEPATT